MPSITLSRPTTRAVKAITNIVGGHVKSVTWRLDNQPNIAEIEVPRKRFHEFRQNNAGKSVYIKIRKNHRTYYAFQGTITSRYFDFNSNNENVSIVCQGPRWKLGGDFIKGRYQLNKDSEYRVLSGLKCIFNEKLEESQIAPQNGNQQKAPLSGVRPFSLNPRNEAESQAYNVNEMLWYIYFVGRVGKSPLENVIGNPLTLTEFGIGELGELEIYDINVDGMSILKAMSTVFKRASMRWWCRPVGKTQSELRAFLGGPEADTPRKYLYLADVASGVAPQRQVILSDILSSKNNIETGRLNEDFSELTNEVFGYGARKIYQTEFTLKPGWDSETWDELKTESIETIRQELRETSSTNWEKYKDIGRKWILDESGGVSGETYDFDDLFIDGEEEKNWSKIARPFLSSLVDGTSFQKPTALNPASGEFEKVEAHIKLLKHQGGIYIEGGELAPPLFVEQNADSVTDATSANPQLASQLKITACVYEDEALEKNSEEYGAQTRKPWLVGILPEPDGTESSITRRMGIIVDQEYQTDNQNSEKEEIVEIDLQNLVTRKREENQDPRVSGSFSIPWITTAYEPGDIIVGIKGRDLYFTAQIIEVRLEFSNSQRTELILEDFRLAQS